MVAPRSPPVRKTTAAPAIAGRALLGVLTALSACGSPSLRRCDRIVDNYIVHDGRVILSETAQRLPDLDLGLQFAIYNCSARYMRPSLTDLAIPIASQGQVAGDFLISNLRSSHDDDALVLSTVELLGAMKVRNTFDVTRDESAMSLLHDRIRAMRSTAMRAAAQAQLARLYSE